MRGLDRLNQNIRYAARVLLKSPGFTIAAIATLALGIGANAAIFSVVKAVMFAPLPYARPDELVMVWNAAAPGEVTHLSLQEVVSYRDDVSSFVSVGGYIESNANITGGDDPERLRSAVVTGELFDTLGVRALLGRALAPRDSAPGAAEVVVIGYGLWQRRFAGNAGIVGQTLLVNGRPREVVGVMPEGFRLPLDYLNERPTELWIAEVVDPGRLGAWGDRSHLAVGRLRPGANPASATSELKIVAERWVRAGLLRDAGDGRLFRFALPLQDFLTRDVRRALVVLLAAVGLVLFVACANLMNLLLARADRRRREIAIRSALGAERRDVIEQLLTESLMLSALGGAAGVGLARAAMAALQAMRPAGLPRADEATVDTTVLLFSAGLTAVTGILFGLAPSISLARQSIVSALNEAARGRMQGQTRVAVRRTLVVAQLAFSVVLVIAAGLLVRTLIELQRIDLGFDASNLLTAQIQLPPTAYPDATVVNFYRDLTNRLEELPGVEAAGAVRILPLSRSIGDWSITVENRPTAPAENPNGDFQWVTPGYLQAMRLTVLRGRWLTSADREDALPVVVINDTMAQAYWPGQDAVGKRFQMGGQGTTRPPMTIVGIVTTLRHNAVVEAPRNEMYLPHAQLPSSVGSTARGMALAIRTFGDPGDLAQPLRDTLRAMDRNLPLSDVRTMEQIAATALSGPRFAAVLLGLFALLALAIAAIGTYATVSLLVSERSHELGIRIALGAARRTIVRSVLREAGLIAGGGIAIGVVAAMAASRALDALLYGVTAKDPVTLVGVPLILAAVALAAAYLPARRAAALDPAATLRRG
jgi:predicted permease